MNGFKYFDVEITSASMDALLSQCNSVGIDLLNIQHLDELKIKARLSSADLDNLNTLAKKRGDHLSVLARNGLYFSFKKCLNRPILLVGMIVWLFLVLYLPTRVLFLRVDGNQTVESARIIDAAERCGIQFGASRRYVRSEKVKNKLLSEIDSLQWAGVNTYGCVAVISVKERSDLVIQQSNHGINSIIAARDGIITDITVSKGTPLCKVGQAVRAGQTLVSGFTDCGLYLKVNTAEAEVSGITNRRISAVTQLECILRTKLAKIKSRYSIQIGKNIVKLYQTSRIPDAGCVKIYTKRYLTLPGGFELPISLTKETSYYYESANSCDWNEDRTEWMHAAADSYVVNDMTAGRIIRAKTNGVQSGSAYYVSGNYICHEIIGQVRIEEIGENNGEGSR